MGHKLFDLTGKTAVVIGGTSGIGLAMAIGLAEAGADVIPSSRRQEQVDEAAAKIEAVGRKTLRIASDADDRASLQALCVGVLAVFDKVDILINCAGKIKREPTLTLSEETWNATMNTNVTGTLRACQIFRGITHGSSPEAAGLATGVVYPGHPRQGRTRQNAPLGRACKTCALPR